MNTFAEAEERLAQTLPGYESRPQQQALARAVEQAFIDNAKVGKEPGEIPTHLIAQAGCGTGKSLGYGIPSILLGRRVIVSVTTKALQDQLSEKDIPFLQENLGVDFRWAVLKGRSNYFCPERALDIADECEPGIVAAMIQASKADGFIGERDSFDFEISDKTWAKVHADSDECSSRNCSQAATCFAQRARARAAEATLVIVNHALFFTDLQIRELTDGYVTMLGEYDFVVFDEAHEVESVATDSLGATITEQSFVSLVTEVRNFAERYADDADVVSESHPQLLGAAKVLFERLETGRLRMASVLKIQNEFVAINEAMRAFRKGVLAIKLEGVDGSVYTRLKQRRDSLLKRTDNLAQKIEAIIAADFAEVVRWVEEERRQFRGEWTTRKVLRSAPIDVGPYLRALLFSQTPTILTSATLEVKGDFDYIAGRLGIDDFSGLDVGTPFDFGTQALTYVPRHLPEPKGDQVRNWETQVVEEIIDLCKASDGRALILFTSTKHMREAYEACHHRMPYNVFMQGQMPQKRLIEEFKSDTHSVLFATRSYFTGVDVQGDSLSLVAIAKMPFPVPTEPMTEARCEIIKANGGNDFSDYTIPVMSLILQQGYGRAIRHRNDRAVVAILDPRLVTKGYGKQILKDLPPAPLATNIEEVQAFFARAAAEAL